MFTLNPYFESELNINKANFTHLPEQATINIFSINGDNIDTISKSSVSQFLEWDMTNINSGIYQFEVETDYGNKNGVFVYP